MKLEDCINFLLTGAQHRVYMMMKKALEPYGLTPIQYGVLACIWQNDLHNPKEIARFLGIENSTISGILERMEDKDLIQRMIDSNDRRYIKIVLTQKSRDLETPVQETVERVNSAVMRNFSPEDWEKFLQLLKIAMSEDGSPRS